MPVFNDMDIVLVLESCEDTTHRGGFASDAGCWQQQRAPHLKPRDTPAPLDTPVSVLTRSCSVQEPKKRDMRAAVLAAALVATPLSALPPARSAVAPQRTARRLRHLAATAAMRAPR